MFSAQHYVFFVKWLTLVEAPQPLVDSLKSALLADNTRFKPQLFQSALDAAKRPISQPGSCPPPQE